MGNTGSPDEGHASTTSGGRRRIPWRWIVTGLLVAAALVEWSVRRPSLATWEPSSGDMVVLGGGEGGAADAPPGHRARPAEPNAATDDLERPPARTSGGDDGAAARSVPEGIAGVRRPGALASVPAVSWPTLAALDLRTGVAGDAVARFDGQRVRVPGYMLPLDDFAEEVATFLLVPYVGACVHTPPPPANQLVLVNTVGRRRVPVEWWRAVWVVGTLRITPVASPYGAASYALEAEQVVPWEEDG